MTKLQAKSLKVGDPVTYRYNLGRLYRLRGHILKFDRKDKSLVTILLLMRPSFFSQRHQTVRLSELDKGWGKAPNCQTHSPTAMYGQFINPENGRKYIVCLPSHPAYHNSEDNPCTDLTDDELEDIKNTAEAAQAIKPFHDEGKLKTEEVDAYLRTHGIHAVPRVSEKTRRWFKKQDQKKGRKAIFGR